MKNTDKENKYIGKLEEIKKQAHINIKETDKEWNTINKTEIKTQYIIKILKRPDLLKYIKDSLEERDVDEAIIGEIHSKLTSFILCNAMNLGHYLMIVFKGSSAVGKTNIANMVTGLFKTKKIGDLSPTALKYSIEDNDYHILYHQETSEKESGRKSFKFISTDDGGFTAETTIKNPDTGEFEIQKTEVVAKGFVTTTTAIELDKEFATRSFMIPLDESKEQTQKIVDFNLSETKRKMAQLEGLKHFGKKYNALKESLEYLNDYDVVLPFESEIKNIFPPNVTLRVRRDSKKLVTVIKASALLFQYQRPKIIVNNELLLVATWQDFYNAIRIVMPIINATVTGFDARTTKAIEMLPEIIIKHGGITSENLSNTMRDIGRNYSGRILKQLNESGYLYESDELKRYMGIKGRTKVYDLSNDNNIESCKTSLQDLDWVLILKKQEEFLNYYSANCKHNRKHKRIVNEYLENYRKFNDIVYDVIDGQYYQLQKGYGNRQFAVLSSEEEKALKNVVCQHIGCKKPKQDSTIKVPIAISEIPFDSDGYKIPMFQTLFDAENEITQILDNPVLVDKNGFVKIEEINDIIKVIFSYEKKQTRAIIEQLKLEGIIKEPYEGYLTLNIPKIRYSPNYSLIWYEPEGVV